MPIRKTTMDKRREAWYAAANLVVPVLELQGLMDYSIGGLFCTVTKVTKADQHIDQIMRVADWLLEDKEK